MQVLIEATNHKEASIIRTLKEGARAIDFLDCPFIRLLADTYHMNIEEPSLVDSLSEYMNYYPHLHISDDNRAYPGLGSLDFTGGKRLQGNRGCGGEYTAWSAGGYTNLRGIPA